jgi:hypothetical protein
MDSFPIFGFDATAEAWGVRLAGTVVLVLLIDGVRRLRETTLIAPIAWAMMAVAAAMSGGPTPRPYLAYTIAVLFIAPTLAALGAKRPQNGAWQFIVLTLLIVLLMPVLQGRVVGDAEPQVHALFRWLIAIHIVVGVVNYLPTRYAVSALFYGAAQVIVAASYIPFEYAVSSPCLAALLYWTIAAGWAAFAARRKPRAKTEVDLLWLDFRDMYGLVWGLRIAERLNAAATQHGWPVEFTWGGMLVKTESGTLDEATGHRIERELRSHLRRFVSHDWIAERMPSERSVAS